MNTFMQYVDRMSRWEWIPWLKTMVYSAVLNVFVLGIATFVQSNAHTHTFMLVLGGAFIVSMMMWVGGICGMCISWLKKRPTVLWPLDIW